MKENIETFILPIAIMIFFVSGIVLGIFFEQNDNKFECEGDGGTYVLITKDFEKQFEHCFISKKNIDYQNE